MSPKAPHAATSSPADSEESRISPRDNLSWVKGKTTPPLLPWTVGRLLAETTAQFGEREAAVFVAENIRWNYRQLSQEADRVAAGLLSLGFVPGDRLGIWAPNCSAWLVTQMATAKIGVILVNINPAYRLTELEYSLNLVQCKGLITADKFKSSDYVAMLQDLAPELSTVGDGELHAAKLPHLRHVIRLGTTKTAGMKNYDEMKTVASAHCLRVDEIAASLSPDDAINIQFTSGTTGFPKGATLTHVNIINNARFIAAAMRLDESDRLCIPVPLYHCFGMVLGNLACLSAGAAMIFPAPGFEPQATLAAVAKERCTALHGVPTMFVAMLEDENFAATDFSSLRTGIMAGSPCPIEVMRQVQDKMNMSEITIAYGMTETSPVSFQSAVDTPLEKRVATVGQVQPHVEVKIVDQNNKIVPLGERGELCARGYLVMRGYWGDEEKTATVIDSDGWMHSGDLAVVDRDGYCNIVGRVKDMVIRGGENIYPREIEEYLFRHPKIIGAQVFGTPDKKYGEELCAWLMIKPGEEMTAEEVKDFCRGQIAHYKIPHHIRFVQEFPMTITGKPQKFKMREKMNAELSRQEIKTA